MASTEEITKKLYGKKFNKQTLRYPLNITTEGTQNIVLFNINVVKGSRFDRAENRQYQDGSENIRIQEAGANSIRSTTTMDRGTVRIDTSIAMYLPGGVSFVYNADWNATEMGAAGRIAQTAGNLGDITMAQLKNLVKEGMVNTAAGAVQALTPLNLKSLSEFTRGTITNPYMEMTFSGVKNREFQFQFKFTPKNAKESVEVENIVKAFKLHQAPERKYVGEGGSTTYWLYPSEFDITFLHKGEENSHINKISTCVLTSVAVDYNTDGGTFETFENGYPVQTNMTLSFMEQEVLTKERIERGY